MSWAKDRFDFEMDEILRDPCFTCDCYDADRGCMMPSIDLSYACPVYDDGFYKDGWHECEPET